MYSIQDVSQKTGLSSHTLRYYEKEGLISGVCRSQGGFRQYTDEDLDRLGLVCCLKNTGMSIHEISRFMQLSREGSHTLAERVDMLLSHRKRMTARIEEMQKNLEKLESRFTTLDAPVIIDRSAQEKDELAQAEWIKVYGALYGCEEQADKIFDELVKKADKK